MMRGMGMGNQSIKSITIYNDEGNSLPHESTIKTDEKAYGKNDRGPNVNIIFVLTFPLFQTDSDCNFRVNWASQVGFKKQIK